jgi:sulfur-oxidizing protein SoxZ
MAKNSIRVRAKLSGDVTTVKCLMKHPMESGNRKDKKTGKMIPAHFIQEVKCTHNGNDVMTALWGGGVSKNPYLSFKFTGGKAGDNVGISWVDNKGESDSVETKIK